MRKFVALTKQLAEQYASVLMIVDGPPGSTNNHALHPVESTICCSTSAQALLDVWLDDYSPESVIPRTKDKTVDH